MNDKISVIVPVYKVERYLAKCIDSILAQTYGNLEIILVDDGSPDRCGVICDEYAKQDSRIVVVHQENRGLSAARNSGLDIATGDMIGFVDSDDWIAPNMYETMATMLLEHQADIAQCGVAIAPSDFVEEDGGMVEIIEKDQLWDAAVKEKIKWTVWCKLYRAAMWKDLRYLEGYYYEDALIIPGVIDRCKRLALTPQRLYFYNRRDEGIVRCSKTMQHLRSKEKVVEVFERYAAKHPEVKTQIAFYLCKYIPSYRASVYANKDIDSVSAKRHNKKMHEAFLRYFHCARTYPEYRLEPGLKRTMWRLYQIWPGLANLLVRLYKG